MYLVAHLHTTFKPDTPIIRFRIYSMTRASMRHTLLQGRDLVLEDKSFYHLIMKCEGNDK